LTDAMLKLEKQQPFYGCHYQGRTFDCGSPEGFVEANVAFALWRSDVNGNMAGAIRKLLDELKPSEQRGAAF
ncbi:UTP--glucose-1-phosphate uridylyltransferase, partial [Mesorhizobium sp. M6A.T.Cr.TU.017.01.1.1]